MNHVATVASVTDSPKVGTMMSISEPPPDVSALSSSSSPPPPSVRGKAGGDAGGDVFGGVHGGPHLLYDAEVTRGLPSHILSLSFV